MLHGIFVFLYLLRVFLLSELHSSCDPDNIDSEENLGDQSDLWRLMVRRGYSTALILLDHKGRRLID